MRKSMRPVTLSRVVETAHIVQIEQKMDKSSLSSLLNISTKRADEILKEMVQIKLLLINNDVYEPTDNCERLLNSIKQDKWDDIHELLKSYSFYKVFYSALETIEPATSDEILEYLLDSDIHFNKVSVDVLCDWGERIESIQRNVFTGQYYPVPSSCDGDMLRAFMDVYNELNVRIGISMFKRYVEIPKIREIVCQRLNIKRSLFDALFEKMYLSNIGVMELSGAPFTTSAKKTNKKIKNKCISEIAEKINIKFSSDKYLDGILINQKTYYYVACHGGSLQKRL
ncbi:hypothetical protein ACSAZK_17505 [Methanosarcina sp. Mfa9]|uniref:hypothetical protein n=1 Tax=Methanosarcina sp. Mfa9 TaxID=3439063 RepID=UPI003F87842B